MNMALTRTKIHRGGLFVRLHTGANFPPSQCTHRNVSMTTLFSLELHLQVCQVSKVTMKTTGPGSHMAPIL